MSRTSPLLALALVATACGPQSAEITVGEYYAFLAASTSPTILQDDLDLEAYKEAGDYSAIDCRPFDEGGDLSPAEVESLRIEGRRKVCAGEAQARLPLEHENWISLDGYHIVREDLSPWRGEGFVTSEGDIQLGFHHRLPGGEDFRFQLVFDPKFQPRECVESADGSSVSFKPLDGDWIAEWSKDAGIDGDVYFLNANTFQFDPEDESVPVNRWFLPPEWRAGTAAGRFAGDRMTVRSSYTAYPGAIVDYENAAGGPGGETGVSVADMFYCDLPADVDPAEAGCMQRLSDETAQVAGATGREWKALGVLDNEALPSPEPLVSRNLWRQPDGLPDGLDGWMEIVYSWVSVDDGSELEVGGAASGQFNVILEGSDSSSRFYLRGRWNVPKLRRDRFTTQFLPEIKAEENETVVCGEPQYDVED